MAQKIYGLTRDHGDGSTGMVWFRNKETVERILDNNGGIHEEFYGNEGMCSTQLIFPDELDLTECGFRFSDDHYG